MILIVRQMTADRRYHPVCAQEVTGAEQRDHGLRVRHVGETTWTCVVAPADHVAEVLTDAGALVMRHTFK